MLCIVKKTVAQIIESGNDYVIQLKGNQKRLYRQAKKNIAENVPLDIFHQEQRSRGRKEIRHVEVYDNIEQIDPEWLGLKRLIYVQRSGYRKDQGRYQKEHFYISSLDCDDAHLFAQGIRGHWLIENQLHYVKDVHFGEDANGINSGQASEIQSILQNIAINIYRCLGYRSIKKATIRYANKIKELFELINAQHINEIKN